MRFVLKDIDLEMELKIQNDSARQGEISNDLSVANKWGGFPSVAAIDFESGDYLLSAPSVVRKDDLSAHYFFFFSRVFYRVSIGMFDSDARISVSTGTDLHSEEFKSSLVAAFATYGRYGKGPLNEFGHPEFAVVPCFVEGSK